MKMLPRGFWLRKKRCILLLILVVAGAMLYLDLRMKYPMNVQMRISGSRVTVLAGTEAFSFKEQGGTTKDFATEISRRKDATSQVPDNSVQNGYQTNETKLSSTLLASQKSSTLKSTEAEHIYQKSSTLKSTEAQHTYQKSSKLKSTEAQHTNQKSSSLKPIKAQHTYRKSSTLKSTEAQHTYQKSSTLKSTEAQHTHQKSLSLKPTEAQHTYQKRSTLKSTEVQHTNIQITTPNTSPQNNYRNNEVKLLERKSSNANGSNILKVVVYTPKYPLFQPAEEEEFPTTGGHLPRIPHIIHQMYADEMIPEMYINLVKSFIKHNPTWKYRFWTDESGRRLLQKRHPYLVPVYDHFGSSVKRSDLLRYAVLYEYGGLYADFDVENLRSLNITTIKYACIVSVEPFEHSVLLYNMSFLMNNAIMSCRPKHPFFKLLLMSLREVNRKGDPVRTTGPKYVTRKFIQYSHIAILDSNKNKPGWTSNSPYFYNGKLNENDNNSVYVPNSQYFMDNIDHIYLTQDGKFTQLCKNIDELPYLSQRACSELYRRKVIRENKKYTFTVHHWYHLWLMGESTVKMLKKINIRDVVPNRILYNG